MSTLHITLLGYFGLLVDGQPLGVVSGRLSELIAYLLLNPQQEHPRRDLAFLLWPDTNETQAQTNLRKLVHQLRTALPQVACLVEIGSRHLKWQGGTAVTCDVFIFEASLARAEHAAAIKDVARERSALEQAVAAYGGDLLSSYDAEWLLPLRERLRRSFFAALERLTLLLEAHRDYAAAIEVARRLVDADPLHEGSYRYLMRLHAASGDRAGALHAYHTLSRVLQRELGIGPSPTTHSAYQELLAAAVPDNGPISPAAPSTVAEPDLVGRHTEWAQLQAAWHAARAGQPGLVLLVGEGGIGKTRLAEEFVEWAGRQGIATATARCYATEQGLAYAPVTSWLRARRGAPLQPQWQQELARLVPELRDGVPPPAELSGEGGQQRLFEALARALLAVQPCLYFVDDLQWCDQATLTWLHFLLRFDPHSRLLIVGTVRPEEVGEEHPLHPLLTSLQDAGRLREIPLQPLAEAETRLLAAVIAAQAAQEISPKRAARLYRESEGNPLLVVELVRAEIEPVPVGARTAWGHLRATGPLPPRVQSLLMARLAPLSATARAVVNLAAIIGRQFTVSVLARASGMDEESLVGALDELWKRQIIREQGDEAYDFSHDKLREAAYASLGIARRRMLHRRVAQALVDVYGGAGGTASSEIASHFEQAGSPADAVDYYHKAAEGALRVLAPALAIPAFENAIRLLPIAAMRAPEHDWGKVGAQLYAGLNEALKQTGQIAAQREHIVLSELQRLRIDRVFDGFDWDEDGYLSARDHDTVIHKIASLRGWTPSSVEYQVLHSIYMSFWDQMQVIRLTHEDLVTREEYRAYMGAMLSNPEEFAAGSRPGVDFTFDLFDADGDGFLTVQEYWQLLRSYRGKFEDLASTFARLDVDGDGRLSRDDFHRIWLEFHLSNDPDAPGNYMLGPL